MFIDKGHRFTDMAKLVIGQGGNQPGVTGGEMMPQPQQHVPGLTGKRQCGFQTAMLQMVISHHGQGEGADIPVPATFHQQRQIRPFHEVGVVLKQLQVHFQKIDHPGVVSPGSFASACRLLQGIQVIASAKETA